MLPFGEQLIFREMSDDEFLAIKKKQKEKEKLLSLAWENQSIIFLGEIPFTLHTSIHEIEGTLTYLHSPGLEIPIDFLKKHSTEILHSIVEKYYQLSPSATEDFHWSVKEYLNYHHETDKQLKELFQSKQCIYEWITLNMIYKKTAKK